MNPRLQNIIDLITPLITPIGSIGSIGALVISVIAIRYAVAGTNKQILTGKYEEIYSSILNLFYHYPSLKFLYHQFKNSHDKKSDPRQRKVDEINFLENLKLFKDQVDIDQLNNTTARLKVLTSSYIGDKNLKIKILAYNDLFEKIIQVSIKRQMFLQEMFYKEGFPEEMELHNYVEKLEEEIVEKMDYGNTFISKEEIRNYREETFKKEIKLQSV